MTVRERLVEAEKRGPIECPDIVVDVGELKMIVRHLRDLEQRIGYELRSSVVNMREVIVNTVLPQLEGCATYADYTGEPIAIVSVWAARMAVDRLQALEEFLRERFALV